MRILIAGQRRFGRAVLELLLRRGDEIAAVSCPDTTADQLHVGALNRGLPILPARLTAALVPEGLDLIIAAHCHAYLSAATRRRAELGVLGYHPSLLPRHRGRSAVEWALRFGEPFTGGTLYWFNDTVDGGPIADQETVFIRPGDTARELWRRELLPLGLRLFERTLARLDRGVVIAEPQDPDLATWEPALDGVPPLWRPDVPMIGSARFNVIPDRRLAEPLPAPCKPSAEPPHPV